MWIKFRDVEPGQLVGDNAEPWYRIDGAKLTPEGRGLVIDVTYPDGGDGRRIVSPDLKVQVFPSDRLPHLG